MKTNKLAQILTNKKIRSTYDATHKKRWFSVVDLCAAINNSDYDTARNYWKWLKNKLYYDKGILCDLTYQMKLPAKDGKMRFTDVMDITDILRLIAIWPGKKAADIRSWIAELSIEGGSVVKYMLEILEECGRSAREAIVTVIGEYTLPGVLCRIVRRDYCLELH